MSSTETKSRSASAASTASASTTGQSEQQPDIAKTEDEMKEQEPTELERSKDKAVATKKEKGGAPEAVPEAGKEKKAKGTAAAASSPEKKGGKKGKAEKKDDGKSAAKTKPISFYSVLEHGPIEAVVEGVYIVRGSIKVQVGTMGRTMAIVKSDDSGLAIFNPIRLNDTGLKKLDKLGEVKHIVVLSENHTIDVPFYCHRYPEATVHAPADAEVPDVDQYSVLSDDTPPTTGGHVIQLTGSTGLKEAAYFAPINGGVLLTADILMNQADTQGSSFLGRISMTIAGIKGSGLIVPKFTRKQLGLLDNAALIDATAGLTDCSFEVLITGHGPAITEDAQAQVKSAISAAAPEPKAPKKAPAPKKVAAKGGKAEKIPSPEEEQESAKTESKSTVDSVEGVERPTQAETKQEKEATTGTSKGAAKLPRASKEEKKASPKEEKKPGAKEEKKPAAKEEKKPAVKEEKKLAAKEKKPATKEEKKPAAKEAKRADASKEAKASPKPKEKAGASKETKASPKTGKKGPDEKESATAETRTIAAVSAMTASPKSKKKATEKPAAPPSSSSSSA